jgi:hypothetical protein
MYGSAGVGSRVMLEVWTKDGRLVAVRAIPVDDEGRQATASEIVLFDGYELLDGIQIPTELTIHSVGEAPREATSSATIKIRTLDLSPDLEPAAFDRPR